MDAKKFGTFIATLRKENNMTQVELTQKLQVTDKAVSKWERGLGFPDINTIEPLADALGVSVFGNHAVGTDCRNRNYPRYGFRSFDRYI